MKTVILIRCGEIILKGQNRPAFEAKLMKNIRKALYGLGGMNVNKSQSRMYVVPDSEEYDVEEAMNRLKKVFGVVSVSPAEEIASDFEEIKKTALEKLRVMVNGKEKVTFKVVSRRGLKTFSLNSLEICRELGSYLLENLSNVSVDVHHPEVTVYVEVRESSYIYTRIVGAYSGMPVGSNGRAMLLLSGGIDSPVAGWMIAKRGVEIEAVHFHSFPYTSERAKEKVIELAKILARYTGTVKLHVVPITDVQLHIHENAPQDELIIILRRAMMRIAESIAVKRGAKALVTGESLGQVASQTMESLNCTNHVVKMPVLRPLIGMDKNEVIDKAREIETFETSILPFEDCCTIFAAKHPVTKPKLERIEGSESKLSLDELIEKAIDNIEVIECEAE